MNTPTAIALAAMLVLPTGARSAPVPESIVHVRDFAFVPATLRVASGVRVRFVNDDDEAHTVTAGDGSFDSGGLDHGEAWTRSFERPGTYAYFCALHPAMRGVIIVTERTKGPS